MRASMGFAIRNQGSEGVAGSRTPDRKSTLLPSRTPFGSVVAEQEPQLDGRRELLVHARLDGVRDQEPGIGRRRVIANTRSEEHPLALQDALRICSSGAGAAARRSA